MNRSDVEKAIHGLYQPRLANDPAQCIERFTEDATFRLAGTAKDGTSAPVVIGRHALLEALNALVSIWRWISIDFDSVLIDGDRAVVRYHLTVEHLPTAETVVTEVVDHVQFDDRLLVQEMVEYLDTALINRLAAQSATH
ncbi:MAG: nuclear transport factor 2 family protein [Pseudomonadota bacterium]